MMKKFISFPKIGDLKSAVRDLIHQARFVGLDENGQPIYSHDVLPTLTFKGTVKLHGTNASVCYNTESGFWVQSRNNIITVDHDNAGFAFFAESHKDAYMAIINQIAEDHNIDLNEFTIAVFGEWAGKSVQRGVAISELDKAFYIFGIKIAKPQNPEFTSYWVDSTPYSDVDNSLFNVDMYKTYTVDIDLNNPKLAVNQMIDLVLEVEGECPISKARGVSGIGEGIVWRNSLVKITQMTIVSDELRKFITERCNDKVVYVEL